MLDISGAGAQPPMRSHWKLRPARSHTKTASSNASATGQAQPQQTAKQALQGKRPSNRNLRPCPTANPHTSPVPPQVPRQAPIASDV